MAPSSRDRISVDLRGLKAALVERSRAMRTTPSDFIRSVLANALQTEASAAAAATTETNAVRARTHLSLRLPRDEARLIVERARAAGLPTGAYVADLCAGVPVLTNGHRPGDHAAALVTSCAELSTLARDLRHLTLLLRQGEVRAAQEYRERLDNTACDVRAHLELAATVLADLRPRPAGRGSSMPRLRSTMGEHHG